jgi:hypothetical protein
MLNALRRCRFSQVNDLIFGQDYFEAHRLLRKELHAQRAPQTNLQELISNINILKKMALCEIKMRDYKKADRNLLSIVQGVREAKYLDKATHVALRKSVYHTYLLYLTLNDPIKGNNFGEETYEIEHSSNIAGMIRFYEGVTTLLNEDFLESKNTLSSIIDDGMDFTLSGMAYNNLGVACWWARHPNYSSLEDEYDRMVEQQEIGPDLSNDDDDSEDLDSFTASAHKIKVTDFNHAATMFVSSIQQFEFSFHMNNSARLAETEVVSAETIARAQTEGTAGQHSPTPSFSIVTRFASETFADDTALIQYVTAFQQGLFLLNPLSAISPLQPGGAQAVDRRQPRRAKKGGCLPPLCLQVALPKQSEASSISKGRVAGGVVPG